MFWSAFGIPGFTLPFNIVSMSFLYVLGLVNYPLLATYIKATPEETLDNYLSNLRRYPGTYRTLSLPFTGLARELLGPALGVPHEEEP